MLQHKTRRYFSTVDSLILQADRALRTLAGAHSGARPSPAKHTREGELNEQEARHSAGLMRVNHTGEVCAQALYQGQALTAKLPKVRKEMEHAADEEIDHLHWCEERLTQLHSYPSRLNPLWYGLSFGIGAGAGFISDKFSLGFVAATEDQVCAHLQDHLKHLPEGDARSREIVNTMIKEEKAHGAAALKAGGWRFPEPVKWLMRQSSKVMTYSSYRI